MTYRNNKSYLSFNTMLKGKKASSSSKAIDAAIIANRSKHHLQDQLAVTESQDVFTSI